MNDDALIGSSAPESGEQVDGHCDVKHDERYHDDSVSMTSEQEREQVSCENSAAASDGEVNVKAEETVTGLPLFVVSNKPLDDDDVAVKNDQQTDVHENCDVMARKSGDCLPQPPSDVKQVSADCVIYAESSSDVHSSSNDTSSANDRQVTSSTAGVADISADGEATATASSASDEEPDSVKENESESGILVLYC